MVPVKERRRAIKRFQYWAKVGAPLCGDARELTVKMKLLSSSFRERGLTSITIT